MKEIMAQPNPPRRVSFKFSLSVICVVVAALLFSGFEVGYFSFLPGRGTTFWDVLFAMQLLGLSIFAVAMAVRVLRKPLAASFPALCFLAAAITIPLAVATYAYATNALVKQGMNPSGPTMNCLTWERGISPSRADFSGDTLVCSFTHIPQLSSAYLGNDELNSSPSAYWISLLFWESLVATLTIASTLLPRRKANGDTK
ncbi:MAG TPA: hypothetical protein VF809_02505 [Candidatus Saccharimonadales bacterium]